MRITSKGQVTVPIDIRRQFGFLPETEVEFVVENKVVILRKKSPSSTGRGARIAAMLRGRGNVSMSTDEILALTRGEK
jgi:AbrB family looped-hinge helix DNA binding protein